MDEKTKRFSILRSIKNAFLLRREANNERRAPQRPPPPPYPLRGGVSPLPPVIRSVNGEVPLPPPPPPLHRARNVSPPPPLPPPRYVVGCQCPADHYLFKRCRLSETNSSSTQQQLCSEQNTQKIKKLKPLHWEKIENPHGLTFWGEIQKSYEALKVPEIDRSELESLFTASDPKAEPKLKSQIEPIRAINCEIILSKVNIPLNKLMDHVLALDDSAIDADQVDMLIRHFPTDAEMELLKGCKIEKDKLGRCEQFFLELMKVPRAKSKLEVFSYKLRFNAEVSEFRECLNVMSSLKEQIRSSTKFKTVMQTILSLGNALNQGTRMGRASGFKLVSLLKLTEMHSKKRNLTLMHYLCKVLADKQPEVLDFSKDLGSLEPASRLPMGYLNKKMKAITEGLMNISDEVSKAKKDGPMSVNFRKALKKFQCSANEEVKSLNYICCTYVYGTEDLVRYFEDDTSNWSREPCCFQVATNLMKFVIMFNQAHKENIQQIEEEKKEENIKKDYEDAEAAHGRCIHSSNVDD